MRGSQEPESGGEPVRREIERIGTTAEEEARLRLAFLLEASDIFASRLDFRHTLAGLVELVVARLADWCTITLSDGEGGFRRYAAAHAHDAAEPLMAKIREDGPPTPESQPGLFEVIRSGQPLVRTNAPPEELEAITNDPEQKRILRQLDTGSILTAPVLKHGEPTGAIFMARSRSRPGFSQDDVDLALELGRMAAVALDNARLHERTRRLNDELERRVEERTAELERANARLEETNRRLENQIVERARTEARLRKQDQQLRRAQRITKLGSWAWRPNANELEWSEETYRIFRLEPGTKPTLELYLSHVTPGDRERVRESIEAALETGSSFSFEHQLVRGDGSKAHVRCEGEISSEPYPADTEMFGTILDITEAKEVENAIRASEERFRFLAENSLHVIVTVAKDGVITYVSPSARQVLGYEPERLVGRNYAAFAHTDDLAAARQEFQRLLDEPGNSRHFRFRYRHADGDWRILEMQGKLPEEPTQEAILNAYDVTERVRAEAEIRSLNAQLKRRSEQLSATNKELESFAYSVSHDLRAPLRSIDGFSRALEEDYGSAFDETAASYIERIRAGTRRMGNLIDDLLALSRLAREELRKERVDLSELARQVGEDLRRNQSHQVRLVVQDGLHCLGDTRLLTVLLENLLDNAWKFTRHSIEPKVEFCGERSGGEWIYCVRDNGAGFDMEYVERIFGAFQRLHPESEFEGTGIGLATVQRIISRHEGRIWAEGKVGEGAAFYFTLPEEAW